MHYLVHANDVPGRERESLEITRKYEALAPRNPHALHMPTHIYTRLGDWDGVIRGNLRAAEAALEYPAGDHGEFVWDEFPHAIEYLVYAYLQKGADDRAAAQLKRLRATARLEPTFKTAFHLASTQARYALERRAWNEAVLIVPREPATLDWDRFTWPEAIARFARGLGAAHLGKVEEARAAVERLEELEAATRKAGEDLFARNIRVLRLELNAWLAHAEGQEESSVALMREAAELEVSTPKHAVTPAPTLPAHELLGDLLMEQKQPAEALAAYKRSMELYPRRFNSLLGAARAARALGDEAQARTFYQRASRSRRGRDAAARPEGGTGLCGTTAMIEGTWRFCSPGPGSPPDSGRDACSGPEPHGPGRASDRRALVLSNHPGRQDDVHEPQYGTTTRGRIRSRRPGFSTSSPSTSSRAIPPAASPTSPARPSKRFKGIRRATPLSCGPKVSRSSRPGGLSFPRRSACPITALGR